MCLRDREYIYENSVLEWFERGLLDCSERFQLVQPCFSNVFLEIIRFS